MDETEENLPKGNQEMSSMADQIDIRDAESTNIAKKIQESNIEESITLENNSAGENVTYSNKTDNSDKVLNTDKLINIDKVASVIVDKMDTVSFDKTLHNSNNDKITDSNNEERLSNLHTLIDIKNEIIDTRQTLDKSIDGLLNSQDVSIPEVKQKSSKRESNGSPNKTKRSSESPGKKSAQKGKTVKKTIEKQSSSESSNSSENSVRRSSRIKSITVLKQKEKGRGLVKNADIKKLVLDSELSENSSNGESEKVCIAYALLCFLVFIYKIALCFLVFIYKIALMHLYP